MDGCQGSRENLSEARRCRKLEKWKENTSNEGMRKTVLQINYVKFFAKLAIYAEAGGSGL